MVFSFLTLLSKIQTYTIGNIAVNFVTEKIKQIKTQEKYNIECLYIGGTMFQIHFSALL